jgi:hypothetical protein
VEELDRVELRAAAFHGSIDGEDTIGECGDDAILEPVAYHGTLYCISTL